MVLRKHLLASVFLASALALGGADIAMLVGLPVSALVYLVACRSLDVEKEKRLAAEADIGLD